MRLLHVQKLRSQSSFSWNGFLRLDGGVKRGKRVEFNINLTDPSEYKHCQDDGGSGKEEAVKRWME